MQHHLLVFLDALVVIENQSAQTALLQANNYYENTRYTLFSIALIVFALVIVIGIVVIRLVSSKNEQVSYQAMHDPLTRTYCFVADTACFAAKDAGRNLVYIYDKQDLVLAEQEGQIQWTSELTAALRDDRFELYAQEIKAVKPDDNISAGYYEILVRFVDKKGKVYPPGAFLPAAERYGQITEIDCWVIEKTFKFIALNRKSLSNFIFSIIVSGRSLGDIKFNKKIHYLFKKYKILKTSICFEITETAAMASFDNALRFIEEFKKAGCTFSLDDFGSGLSSFAYLKQLPVDILKIDGIFVHNLDVEPIDYAMVKSINEIAHLYNKKTVAEFVASEAVFDKLVELGVDYAQGYAISKPYALTNIVCKSA